MKKIIKLTTSILLAIIAFVASIMNANAAASTISIGEVIPVDIRYIAERTFSYKVTTDGRYLYCLEEPKERVSNVTAYLVQNSTLVDGGVLYIMKNGFPEKSITGDKNKDYYITQNAIWWYLDIIHGTSNVDEAFKSTGQDSYDMRKYVKQLVNGGVAHRNDKQDETMPTLALNSDENLTLQNGYYISKDIKATATGITQYTVTIDNPVKDIIIVPSNGQEFSYYKSFTLGVNDTFKIKVPATSITKETTLNMTATATGNTIYKAYEYKPANDNMQRVALLEKTGTSTKTTAKVSISTMQLSINKIDANTKEPLAGATLVLKNSSGKELYRWTTTTSAYVIKDLQAGTYTVEEVEAPKGYELNKKPVTVQITNNKKSYTVTMENTPKVVVVSINKIDANTKKPIEGATLVLKDSTGKEITRWVSTINAHIVKNLPEGTYTVEEVEAPAGYKLNTKPVSFKVVSGKKSYSVTMENTPKNIVININKIDANTKKPLAGAVLVIKDSKGNLISRFVTDEKSHVIQDIPYGTYTVEEESAPAGYIKSNEKVTFTVDDNHQSHQITITNTKETPVPDTGTESIIIALIGIIILGIGLDFILKNAKA